MIQKKINILRAIYLGVLMVALLIVVAFETALLPIGTQAADSAQNYILEMTGVVLTLIAIPLALRLMNFTCIKRQLHEHPERYFPLSLLRISILGVALLFDVVTYYLSGLDATLGYLGLMVVVGMLFAWPSQGKMEYECATEESQDESK